MAHHGGGMGREMIIAMVALAFAAAAASLAYLAYLGLTRQLH